MMYGLLGGLWLACAIIVSSNGNTIPLTENMTERQWTTAARGNMMRSAIRVVAVLIGFSSAGAFIGLIIRGS